MAVEQYAYKVRDRTGKIVEGKVEAESEAAVRNRLREMGAVPLEIRRSNTGLQTEISFGSKRVKMRDLAVFSRQFATMINSGLSMLRALSILTEQSENDTLKKTLRTIKS